MKYQCYNDCFGPDDSPGFDVEATVYYVFDKPEVREVKIDEYGTLLGYYCSNMDRTRPIEYATYIEFDDTPRCGCCGDLVEENS